MAVCSRKLGAAERLMEVGASAMVDGPDGLEIDGNMFLHNAQLVKSLVAKGLVDVGAATRDRIEPLATACDVGQFRIAIALLEPGADCHTRIPGRSSNTTLHVALDAYYEMGTAPLVRGTSDGYADYLEGRR
ncbi:sex-determining protein fem-1 [Colletotrichum liriopes]|uniref:Sex-determining protein fem-1 n=1 Tax=Colletotrichum liriopes TaxID=708192 RepID=A0AA37LZH2_9PEZI|nr:sex-determining protein fem-1 [Colletotrichum liriopes]